MGGTVRPSGTGRGVPGLGLPDAPSPDLRGGAGGPAGDGDTPGRIVAAGVDSTVTSVVDAWTGLGPGQEAEL